jgi:hypothetical protein
MIAETYAERIARIARSAAAQAVVDSAPPLTRQQLDTARAACSAAVGSIRQGVQVTDAAA